MAQSLPEGGFDLGCESYLSIEALDVVVAELIRYLLSLLLLQSLGQCLYGWSSTIFALWLLLDRHLGEEGGFEHLGSVKAHQVGGQDDYSPLEATKVTNQDHERVELALLLKLLVG